MMRYFQFTLIAIALSVAQPFVATSLAAQTPQITSVSRVGTSQYQDIVINGSGLGTHNPYIGDTSYISLWDLTKGWQAGYVGSYWGYYTENTVTLIVVSWEDNQITLGGFSGGWGENNWTLDTGDSVQIDVWNPQSGNGPASVTTTVSSNSFLLVDNFTQDSNLNPALWTASSSFLTSFAAASSSPPATFIPPALSFAPDTGMHMSGPTEDYQTTGVQSLATFTPPFTVVAHVTGVQATADFFEVVLASADLTQYLTVTADVNPTYFGMWNTAPNVGQLYNLGVQFSPPVYPALKTTYKVIVRVDSEGLATATIENSAGQVLSSAANLQPGLGPFYLVLGQRIGLAPTGSQVANWSLIRVFTP